MREEVRSFSFELRHSLGGQHAFKVVRRFFPVKVPIYLGLFTDPGGDGLCVAILDSEESGRPSDGRYNIPRHRFVPKADFGLACREFSPVRREVPERPAHTPIFGYAAVRQKFVKIVVDLAVRDDLFNWLKSLIDKGVRTSLVIRIVQIRQNYVQWVALDENDSSWWTEVLYAFWERMRFVKAYAFAEQFI